MTTDQLIGTLEVIREDLASLAYVQIVGLAESFKATNPAAADSLSVTGDNLLTIANVRLVGLIEMIKRGPIDDAEGPDATGGDVVVAVGGS